MVQYPEVQRKAQVEIDRVIGSTRLPDFNDRPALPYLEAIYREVMRWSQSIPLGVPHALSEDDYYKGYFIPKGAYYILLFLTVSNLLTDIFSQRLGTTVFGNIWFVCLPPFLLLR